MNNLIIFENAEFGKIRTVEIDGKPYFIGSDVAKSLGYAIPSKAVNTHCKGVSKTEVPSNGGKQEMLIISEGDVYRLIAHSKLPSAERFESWVFDEVLPSIRKHGAYMTEDTIEKALTSPDFLIQLATNLKEEREKRKLLEAENKANAPKVLFADTVTASERSILVRDLAKLLKQKGIEIGEKRLYAWLRENGYIIKCDKENKPTQKAMNLGLFELEERVINNPDGEIIVKFTTKVTGKGQQYFINKFVAKNEVSA